ncbi:MAG: hypothetical protein ABW048_12495 [Sphingobium sp.]
MRTIILTMAALTLLSCGEAEEPVAKGGPAPETGAAAAVAKLDEAARNGVLERAIRASGAACPVVKESARIEVRQGVRGWKAQCDNGTAHLIEVLSDGTAKVTSRRD